MWPEPNGQQFSVRATNLFFDVNVTRITPTVVDKNSKSPSLMFTALWCDSGLSKQSESHWWRHCGRICPGAAMSPQSTSDYTLSTPSHPRREPLAQRPYSPVTSHCPWWKAEDIAYVTPFLYKPPMSRPISFPLLFLSSPASSVCFPPDLSQDLWCSDWQACRPQSDQLIPGVNNVAMKSLRISAKSQ